MDIKNLSLINMEEKMNEKEVNHCECMTKIIETYLSEMFKHYNEISLTVLEISH